MRLKELEMSEVWNRVLLLLTFASVHLDCRLGLGVDYSVYSLVSQCARGGQMKI